MAIMEKEKKMELFRKYLEITGKEDEYGILCKDDEGYYVRYAFRDGCPEDCRCLSWYDKPQYNAYKRNEWDDEHIKVTVDAMERKVGEIRRLSMFCCDGYEQDDLDCRCRPGHPSPRCLRLGNCSQNWTYEEPVKCACWYLGEKLDIDKMKVEMSVTELKRLLDRLK